MIALQAETKELNRERNLSVILPEEVSDASALIRRIQNMSEAAGMEVVTFEADPGGEADQPNQGEEEEADCCAEEANLTEGMLRGFHF